MGLPPSDEKTETDLLGIDHLPLVYGDPAGLFQPGINYFDGRQRE